MKKTKVIAIAILLLGCIILGILFYLNVEKPLQVKGTIEIDIDEFDAYSLELLQTMYQLEKTEQSDDDWVRFYDELPSEDYKDYVTVTISATMDNRSFLNQDGMFSNIEGVVKEDKVVDQCPMLSLHYVNSGKEKD